VELSEMTAKLTHKEFVLKANKTQQTLGRTFSYLSKYQSSGIKLKIKCNTCGNIFYQTSSNHLYGKGCTLCSRRSKTGTLDTFVLKSKKVHKSIQRVQYQYHNVIYINNSTKVSIVCPDHGDFYQTPNAHLAGHGCAKCVRIIRASNTKEFIKKAKTVHGTLYTYNKVLYINSYTHVSITCPRHGDFLQTPGNHLFGNGTGCGCPKCDTTGTSKIAIKWIEEYAYSHRLKNVQHALNGGEFVIPGTNIRVDGYHKASNTVFEFHGSAFHGDPEVYRPNDHPNWYRPNATAKRLYKETLEREKKIRALGYNLVIMWESEYR
jgi:hypothetical protein